jgi:hypothetical protein
LAAVQIAPVMYQPISLRSATFAGFKLAAQAATSVASVLVTGIIILDRLASHAEIVFSEPYDGGAHALVPEVEVALAVWREAIVRLRKQDTDERR